jgi:hypothetical protein
MAAYLQIATGDNTDGPTTWGTGAGVFPVAGDTVTLKTGCTVNQVAAAACVSITHIGTSKWDTHGFALVTTGIISVATAGAQFNGNNSALTIAKFGTGTTGEFIASSGTTIMIGAATTLIDINTGTFTHNGGKIQVQTVTGAQILITTSANPVGRTFFDLEFAPAGAQYYVSPTGSSGFILQVANDLTIGINATLTTNNAVYTNHTLTVQRDLIINGILTNMVTALHDRIVNVTRNAIVAGTWNANINGDGRTITVGSIQVSAGGLYSATSGQTIFSLDSSNAGTIRLPANCTLKSTDATKTLTLTTDIDWDFSAGTKTIKDFICALGAAMTTGGGGITLKNDNVDWSAGAARVQTISVGDTFQIISNSDILTPTTIKTTVRGTLLVDTGITFKSGDIDAYGQVKTTGSGRINAQNRTVTGEATRMQLPVTYTNAVIRGDYYQDDIYNIGGCDLGLGYSY